MKTKTYMLVAVLLLAALLSGCTGMSEEEYEQWAREADAEFEAQVDRADAVVGDWAAGHIDSNRAASLLRDTNAKVQALSADPPDSYASAHRDFVQAQSLYARAIEETIKCEETYDARHCDEADSLTDRLIDHYLSWREAVGV